MGQLFEKLMIEQCAPTLAGIKPANLFRYHSDERHEVYEEVRRWDRELSPYGITVTIVKECARTNSFLIYIYRQKWLARVLSKTPEREFLKSTGYHIAQSCEGFLKQLSKRLCVEEEFPHEIGVFLGYPLQDVIGFIENKGENYTCCGCWKAYGDPEEAVRRFDAYRQCTSFCKERYENGVSIIQLVSAA